MIYEIKKDFDFARNIFKKIFPESILSWDDYMELFNLSEYGHKDDYSYPVYSEEGYQKFVQFVKNDLKNIKKYFKFEDKYVSDIHKTTTYYFCGPKTILEDYFFEKDYKKAIYAEISIEVPNERKEASEASVMVGIVERISNDDFSVTDLTYANIDIEDIKHLLSIVC